MSVWRLSQLAAARGLLLVLVDVQRCLVLCCGSKLLPVRREEKKQQHIFHLEKSPEEVFFPLVFLYIYNIEMPPGLTKQMLLQIPAAASFVCVF